MLRSLTDEEIDQMVAEDLADVHEHREEVKALRKAIGDVPDPLLRRILYKIVELSWAR